MSVKKSSVTFGGIATLYLVMLNAIILETAYTSNKSWYTALIITVPLLLFAIIMSIRKSVERSSVLNEFSDRRRIDSMEAVEHDKDTRPQLIKEINCN